MLLFCLKEGRLGLSCGIVGVVQTCVLELLRNRFRSLSPCAWTPFLFVKSHCASYFFVLSRWVLPIHSTSLHFTSIHFTSLQFTSTSLADSLLLFVSSFGLLFLVFFSLLVIWHLHLSCPQYFAQLTTKDEKQKSCTSKQMRTGRGVWGANACWDATTNADTTRVLSVLKGP